MDLMYLINSTVLRDGDATVVIAGPTCSGKSTLAEEIRTSFIQSFKKVTVVHQDNYYKDLSNIPKIPNRKNGYLTDLPVAFNTDDFVSDAIDLVNNRPIKEPQYDVRTNTRTLTKVPHTKGVINIFEGLHAIALLKPAIRNAIFVYVDTPIEVCRVRRVTRDVTIYGIPRYLVTVHFESRIVPMYIESILPQRELASIIIPGE